MEDFLLSVSSHEISPHRQTEIRDEDSTSIRLSSGIGYV